MRARKQDVPEEPERLADELTPELSFMRAVWAVDHGLQSTSKRMRIQLGVTGPQRLVIRMLARFPRITAGQLAGLLHVHPSTLTGILKRLEDRHIISRKPDPEDGRRVRCSLTAKGNNLEKLEDNTVESAVARALSKVPRDQVKMAQELLRRLAEELQEELQEE